MDLADWERGALALLSPHPIQGLELWGNPFVEPLAGFVAQGRPAVMAYLRSLADAAPRYEAKLVLVGTARVGKSSLLARLRREGFDPHRDFTQGIERGRLLVVYPSRPMGATQNRWPSRPMGITLNTWDFGGDELYQLTHQFFWSAGALYLLVWHPGQPTEPAAVGEWLRRIRLQVGDQARVLLVASHADDYQAKLKKAALKRRHGDVLAGSYRVDNRSGRGINELSGAIATQAARLLPADGEPLSDRWIAVRETLRARQDLYLSYGAYQQLCAAHGVTDPDEADALLGLLHTRGQLLHYASDPSLREVVVLQPDWLTAAVSQVLHDPVIRQAGGVLDHARLHELWRQSPDGQPYTDRAHAYLLRLLEVFDLSYRLEGQQASLVPQLLPADPPPLPWTHATPPKPGERVLSLVLELTEPVSGLTALLLARNRHAATQTRWRDGALLADPGGDARALLSLTSPVRLALTVRGPEPMVFFWALLGSAERLLAQRWQGLTYQALIPCPAPGTADPDTRCTGMFALTKLRQLRDDGATAVACPDCHTVHDLAAMLTGLPGPTAAPPADTALTSEHQPPPPAAPELVIPAQQSLTRAMLTAELEPVVRQLEALELRIIQRIDQTAERIDITFGWHTRHHAHAALALRALLHASQTNYEERSGCPRLFTLVPANAHPWRDAIRGQVGYQLTLWCQQPDAEHPWGRPYEFHRPTRWLTTIAPYAVTVSRLLQAVFPVAAAAAKLAVPDLDATRVQAELNLMGTLIDQLPATPSTDHPELPAGPRAVEGPAVRAVRELLDDLDREQPPYRGLRVVQRPSGEYLWVCPYHRAAYQPGLPSLPPAPRIRGG